MKDKMKIRWWLHILIFASFAILIAFEYSSFFYSDTSLILNLEISLVLTLSIIIELVWLFILLVKSVTRKQFLNSFFILLLMVADIALMKIIGFILAVTIVA